MTVSRPLLVVSDSPLEAHTRRDPPTQLRLIKYELECETNLLQSGQFWQQFVIMNSERNEINHKLEIAQVKLRHWSGWLTAISALGKFFFFKRL